MKRVRNRRLYTFCGCILILLSASACAMNDLEIKTPSNEIETTMGDKQETELSSESDTCTEAYTEVQGECELNDTVICGSGGNQLISDGTMHLTITEAKAYKSFVESELSEENFHMDVQEYGENYPFILLHVVFENIDATSYKYKFDKRNELVEYDFSAEALPFLVSKQFLEDDGFDQNYVYGTPVYFSNSIISKEQGLFFHLEPGDKIELDIGFVPIWGGIESLSRRSDDYDPTQFYASSNGYKPSDTYIDLQITDWED